MISNERMKEIVLAIANNQSLEAEDDISDICKVFKDHSLLNQLYNVYHLEYLKKYYLSGILVSQYQDSIIEEIKHIFNENGIDFIFLKGSFIRQFYPDYFMRLMGDIDVLVRAQDVKRASELLLNYKFESEKPIQSYNFEKLDEFGHHIEFKKNNVIVELHHKLFSDKFSWTSYFDAPWNYAKNKKNHEYEFDSTFFYLFQIGHLVKHMYSFGAGIRPYIDFYYMLKEYPVNMDELMPVAKDLKLDKFFNSVLNVVDYMFDFAPYEYTKMNYLDKYIAHIIESGVHGHSSNNSNNVYANIMAREKKSKFKFYLQLLFPNRKIMKVYYPYLEKHPILFPIARVQRVFTCVFVKRKKIKKVENSIMQRNELIKIYDEIGLNQ
ncbi:MAG: nucleotidyltransferase family protein [Erysipelotrichales bacterium]|nr:nucleotidyltransferase family protein [Erysipelotrichales bacterium]